MSERANGFYTERNPTDGLERYSATIAQTERRRRLIRVELEAGRLAARRAAELLALTRAGAELDTALEEYQAALERSDVDD